MHAIRWLRKRLASAMTPPTYRGIELGLVAGNTTIRTREEAQSGIDMLFGRVPITGDNC